MLAAGLPCKVYAAEYRVCLDFELGDELYDASRANGSGQSPCDDETERCPANELCISTMFDETCTPEKGETHGRDEGDWPFPAMGTLARVVDEEAFVSGDPGSVLWGWSMLDIEGCTEVFTADFVTSFQLQYFLWSENPTEPDPADRNFVLAYGCSGMPSLSSCTQDIQVIESITPNGGGDTRATRVLSNTETLAQERAHYPYWGSTFAESRWGQPEFLPLTDRGDVYVVVDTDAVHVPGSQANWMFGGQPTAWAKGNGWHYKFTTAHEYAHALVQQLGLNMQAAHIDYSRDGTGHSLSSVEWAAAAAVEGFADFYSLAVWHDLEGAGQRRYLTPGDELVLQSIFVPRLTPICGPSSCDPGTANEADWMGALVDFYRDGSSPTFGHILGMNAAAHDAACIGLAEMDCTTGPTCTWSTHASNMCVGWPVNGTTASYWNQFDAGMQGYLTTAEYAAWELIAADHEIAR